MTIRIHLIIHITISAHIRLIITTRTCPITRLNIHLYNKLIYYSKLKYAN